jgi:hypothetical protein
MGAIAFDNWVKPDLELQLRGKTYTVPPPDVERAQKILAAAVLGEIRLGLVRGDVPEEVTEILSRVSKGEHFALTDEVHRQMVADKVPQVSIDRMAYYAVFYWARGQEYADTIAALMWGPEIAAEAAAAAAGEDTPAPKARRSSRRKSGSSTA